MSEPLALGLWRTPTPIGVMLVATDADSRLRALDWESHTERMNRLLARLYRSNGVRLEAGQGTNSVVEKLQAYFGGDFSAIDDIAVEAPGTPFQTVVWTALRQIPAGQTWSYGQLASYIGRPTAVRAVGLANGANPVGIVTPCHRVISAGGGLTGYGGGLERKRWLLAHERAALARRTAA